jgi:cytochrome c nitrite reductase small subunit
LDCKDSLKNRRVRILGVVASLVVLLAAGGFAAWKYHEQPQFCATCHVMKPYLDSWQNPQTDFAAAHKNAGMRCLDCHEAKIKEQVQELVTYVTGKYTTSLETRRFPKEWCLRCHEHSSYEELAQRTKDYMVPAELFPNSTPADPAQQMQNPHASHLGQEQCYKCHKMHQESPQMAYCFSCHHSRQLVNCNTCHMSGS